MCRHDESRLICENGVGGDPLLKAKIEGWRTADGRAWERVLEYCLYVDWERTTVLPILDTYTQAASQANGPYKLIQSVPSAGIFNLSRIPNPRCSEEVGTDMVPVELDQCGESDHQSEWVSKAEQR